MSQKLSSAAVVIGALMVRKISQFLKVRSQLSSGTRCKSFPTTKGINFIFVDFIDVWILANYLQTQ